MGDTDFSHLFHRYDDLVARLERHG
jgi:hypothetical protein